MIKRIYSNAFKKNINELDDNFKVSILTGGLKSAVYLIEDSDFQVVLKFSNDNGNLLSLDANSFWWEANVLKNFDHEDTCIPYLYYYDSSCELSDEEYLFMSYLDGENYTHIKEKFTKEEQNHIEYVIGVISKKICSHIKEKFFLPSNPSKQFESNYDFTSYLFNSLFQDAKKYELDILSLQQKVDTLENSLKTERNNERNLYGDNCKLRLEIDVLKNEISKLKGEEVAKKVTKKTEEKKEEKSEKETPKRKSIRRRKVETKKDGE